MTNPPINEEELADLFYFRIVSDRYGQFTEKTDEQRDECMSEARAQAKKMLAAEQMYEALMEGVESLAGEQRDETELERAFGYYGRVAIQKMCAALRAAEG